MIAKCPGCKNKVTYRRKSSLLTDHSLTTETYKIDCVTCKSPFHAQHSSLFTYVLVGITLIPVVWLIIAFEDADKITFQIAGIVFAVVWAAILKVLLDFFDPLLTRTWF